MEKHYGLEDLIIHTWRGKAEKSRLV